VVPCADDVPPFALQEDKVVEIQGEPTGMHKALELIASHLRKFLVDRSVIPVFELSVSYLVLFFDFLAITYFYR